MNNRVIGQFSSIEQMTGQLFSAAAVKKTQTNSDISFDELLQQKKNEQVMEQSALKFSKHATMRLSNRNIHLTEEMNGRLENGVEEADRKGIKESLVLVDSLAFIVNVPSKTVVTAMDQKETNNNVFTNIDGAVIV